MLGALPSVLSPEYGHIRNKRIKIMNRTPAKEVENIQYPVSNIVMTFIVSP
jgi:hypothetical protein